MTTSKIAPNASEEVRLAAPAKDRSLYVVWHWDNTVTVRNRAWQVLNEGFAQDKPAFDALCIEHEVEPVLLKLTGR